MKYVYGTVALIALVATLGRTVFVVHMRLAIRRNQRRHKPTP